MIVNIYQIQNWCNNFEAAFQILLYQITRKLESSNGKQVIYSAKTLIYYPVKLLVAGSIITNDIS